MRTMKSIVTSGNGTVELREFPVPEFSGYEMLVRMKAVALCGTDYSIINKTLPKLVKEDDYPLILGHECVGEVAEVGSNVRTFKKGDLVVCNPTKFEPIDGYGIFWGGMSECAVVHDYQAMKADGRDDWQDICVMKIPQDFDPVYSTMIYSLRETFNAARLFGFEKGHSIVIYGAGAIGTGFVKICKLMGMSPIISVDMQEDRLENALKAGADSAINPEKANVKKEIMQICPEGVDHTLDAAGVAELMNDGIGMIKNDCSVNIFAEMPKNQVHFKWENAPNNFSLNFCQQVPDPGDAVADAFILEGIQKGLIDCSSYVSDVFDLKDYKDAFELLMKKGNKKKIVLKFDA